MGTTHASTGEYLWYEDETTAEMTSDDNDIILYTDDDQYKWIRIRITITWKFRHLEWRMYQIRLLLMSERKL